MMDTIYLDNAATSFPKAPAVCEAVLAQLTSPCGNANRGTHAGAQAAHALVERTRLALATRMGSSHPEQWAFFLNATDALNAAIKGTLTPDGHAVTTTLAHTSVLRPLQGLRERAGVKTTITPVSREGFLNPEAVISAITPTTELVVLIIVSNVVGTRQPVEPVIAACRERGVPVLLDASQAAGDCPIETDKLRADMIALPCHKGLLGPQGVGALYVRPGMELRAWREGGSGTDSHDLHHPCSMPTHMEAGTQNLPGIAGLLAALQWHVDDGEAPARHLRQLRHRLYVELSDLDGCIVYGTASQELRPGPISFNIAGWNPTDVANVLDTSFGIAVRAGLHCAPLIHADIGAPPEGTVRVSPGPFTSDTEASRFLDAIKEIAANA